VIPRPGVVLQALVDACSSGNLAKLRGFTVRHLHTALNLE